MRAAPLATLLLVAALMAGGAWWLIVGNTPAPPQNAVTVQADTVEADTEGAGTVVPVTPGAVAAEPAEKPETELHRSLAPRNPQHAVGRAVDHKGTPVRGARITCWRSGDELKNTAHTDSDGAFCVEVPPGRTKLRLEVVARGHLLRRVTHPVPADGSDATLGDVRLRSGAVLGGRVVEAGGKPIAGASVFRVEAMAQSAMRRNFERIVRQQNRGGAVTDDEGRFLLENTRAGSFSLIVGHPDYPVAWLLGRSVEAGAVLDDLVVVVQPGASIRGRIAGFERAQGTVVVMAWHRVGRGARTDRLAEVQAQISELEHIDPFTTLPEVRRLDVGEDGTFGLSAIPTDARYSIWAREQDPTLQRSWRCSQKLEVSAGEVGVVLRYDPGATVTFRIVDDETGEPITRARVTPRLTKSGGGLLGMLSGKPLVRPRTCDHEGGRVTLRGLRPADGQVLSLDVRVRGYERYRRGDIAVPARGAFDLGDVRLKPRRKGS